MCKKPEMIGQINDVNCLMVKSVWKQTETHLSKVHVNCTNSAKAPVCLDRIKRDKCKRTPNTFSVWISLTCLRMRIVS